MAESFERETKEGYKGPVDDKGKGVYGKRNPDAVIEARCRRLFLRQGSGLSTRQLVLEHSDRESIAVTTGWKDWARVNEWLQQDWENEKAKMHARLNNMRLRAINMALKKSQLSSAQALMADLGRSIGEGTEFTTAEEVKLNISIEPQQNQGET
jgi:hypothetical protein